MPIHPTAIIDSAARIASSASVGPYCIIDGPVVVGENCTLQAGCRLIGPLVMGAGNVVHTGAVLGDVPQDAKFNGQSGGVVVGSGNVFREGVTVHRAVGADATTRIASHCYLMANSHVGHNGLVEDNAMLINGALMGGHSEVGKRAILGGNCALHQHCRLGRLSMISNVSAFNTNVPPFVICMVINRLTQLNVVGLRRAGVPQENIRALHRMFRFLHRTHGDKTVLAAAALLPPDLRAVPEVAEYVSFFSHCKRAVAHYEPWSATTRSVAKDNEGPRAPHARRR